MQKMKKVYSLIARDYVEVPDVPPAPPRSRPAIASGRDFVAFLERSIDEVLAAERSAREQETAARIAAEQRANAAEARQTAPQPAVAPVPARGTPMGFDIEVMRDGAGWARNYRVKETAVPDGQRPVELDVAVQRDSAGLARGYQIKEII